MTSNTHIPQLRVSTRPLERAPDLVGHADAQNPLLWVRGDRGMVGAGEVLRLSFFGRDRFAQASATWKVICNQAHVTDPLQRPGTGLVAMGTFTFADNSSVESVLIVPQTIVGRDGDVAWITEIMQIDAAGPADDTAPADAIAPETPSSDFALPLEPPAPVETEQWRSIEFDAPQAEADAYRSGVAHASHSIGDDEIEKIVLARRLHARLEPTADLRVPLTRLSDRYTDCWTFAVDGMIGASPETLIRAIGGNITARVLAGTRKRSLDAAHDLVLRDELSASSKEQHEHALAVTSLVDTLTPHVRDLKSDETPYLLELPNVWHLSTNVSATLADGANSIELADAVHPTAAVAGTPTSLAIIAIDALEPFDRGRYAGAVGWINAAGDGEWAIALRSAQITEHPSHRTVTAYAGGGIVAGSDPERELIETVAKFRPIVEAFS